MSEVRSFSDSTVVAASPEQLYDLVTDIARTGEWSPSCRECWWADGASGPQVGARFHGRNEGQGRSWETVSEVVAAERGRVFSWVVGEGYVAWDYGFEATDEGARLTESWELRPAGIALFNEKYGDRAETLIALRTQDALTGIPMTLAAIKRIAEHAG